MNYKNYDFYFRDTKLGKIKYIDNIDIPTGDGEHITVIEIKFIRENGMIGTFQVGSYVVNPIDYKIVVGA